MIVGIDLETTGLDKKYDKIIEVALIKFDEKTFKVIEKYTTFINPGIGIPDLISNITNIYDSDVENAPSIQDIKKEICDFIGDSPLLGHNVFFDRDFLVNNDIDVSTNITVDTFFLANFLNIYDKSLNLEMLCNSYGIGFSGAHRALNDIEATVALLEKLCQKFEGLDQEKKDLLFYIFSLSEDKNIEYLSFLLFGEKQKLLKFEEFESIILKIIKSKINLNEDIVDKKYKKKKIKTLFSGLGSVEKRDNQLKMSEHIEDSLTYKKKTVIEAPTGLGKSFAYLIPSIQHSLSNKQKVFISTKTKNLQDQLFEKDLSYLGNNLGVEFSYAKLKGKANYVSIKGFFDEILLGDINYSKVNFLSKLSLWFYDTEYGELDELNFFGVEFTYLRYINAEGFHLSSDSNPYKNYEFLVYARYLVEISDIIVINHSLLFSDIHSENGVLGKIKNLVIDEAHNIEDSVTESVKQRMNEKNISEFFDMIESTLTKKNIKKIDFLKNKELFLSKLNLIMDYSSSYVEGKVNNGMNYKVCLVKDDYFEEADVPNIGKQLGLHLLDIVDDLINKEEHDFGKEISYLNTLSENIRLFLKQSETSLIKTVSYNEKSGVTLEHTLLNPGNYLFEKLWNEVDSVILTSATLQISGKFDYIKNILQLKDFDFFIFESDFDYSKQATLFVPNDLGNIKNNSEQIVSFLGRFYSIAKGKTLTLLTSFSIIKKIYTQLNKKLLEEGVHLYPQGVGGSKSKLLSFYLEQPENSILLGTDSFWEGVDIPGDKLKYLVIHKFPFSVPTDPIFEARSVFFNDPFLEYSIPKAIIKLKQGFGRLIRTKNDSGIVVLLDDRIYSTKWGELFLGSFPENINKKYVSSDKFLSVLKKVSEK